MAQRWLRAVINLPKALTHVALTPLLSHNCNVATVMDNNVNIRYVGCLIFDPCESSHRWQGQCCPPLQCFIIFLALQIEERIEEGELLAQWQCPKAKRDSLAPDYKLHPFPLHPLSKLPYYPASFFCISKWKALMKTSCKSFLVPTARAKHSKAINFSAFVYFYF